MSDNIILKYLFDHQNLNAIKARWLSFLSEYDFEIKHIKRKENYFFVEIKSSQELSLTLRDAKIP